MADVDVKPSPIQGLGIFAARAFRPGERIGRVNIVREVTAERPLNAEQGELIEHCAYPDDKVVLWGFPDRHVNHSCDPNAWVLYEGDDCYLVARRDLTAGEEITCDYNINIGEGTAWPCNCGASRCRGIVEGGFFRLPLAWQREYRPYLADWFVRRHRERLAELDSEPGPQMSTGVTLTDVLFDEAETSYAVLERLIQKVRDEDLPWRPIEGRDWMTVGQLLMHCGSYGCGKAVQGFVTGTWPSESGAEEVNAHVPPVAALPAVRSVREALDRLVEDRKLTVSSLRAAGEANLLARRVAAPWGGPERSLFQQLSEMLKHLAQHKGQLFYYLKLMGREVNSRDLWGA